MDAKAQGSNSVAIGAGTVVTENNVVDFGSGRQVRVSDLTGTGSSTWLMDGSTSNFKIKSGSTEVVSLDQTKMQIKGKDSYNGGFL